MDYNRTYELWTDWTTVWGDFDPLPSNMDLSEISTPRARVIDLGQISALDAEFDVTDVKGGATLFLGASVSEHGPYAPIAEIDTTNFPKTSSVSLRVAAGLLTITTPDSPTPQSASFGRFLAWFVRAPSVLTAKWAITVRARVSYVGAIQNYANTSQQFPQAEALQPLVMVGGAGTIQRFVLQSFSAWKDTSNLSQFIVQADAFYLNNCGLYLQTSLSGDPVDWVDVVPGGITAIGRTSYLLTREAGATSATMLRNLFRWELRQTAGSNLDWQACLKLTGIGR